jgi:hypothetical protein
VKELTNSVENLDSSKPPSIPIYHGSIIHIKQHRDDQNISDLIVRVPNFHHVSIPSVTISIDDGQTPRIKRRAPICPINQNKTNESENLNHAKRLAIGLRNLRRTIITNCKVKRSTNFNQITIVPTLPDVEIIREDFQVPIIEKKNSKHSSLTSKFLFIKRKKYQVNQKPQTPTNSIDTQTDYEENQTNQSSRANLHLNDNDIHHEEKEQSTNDLQPDTFISTAKIDLITNIKTPDDLERELDIVHPNDDTYSECYEVTYEFDPEFQHFINDNNEKIYLPEVQSTNLDSFNYQDLPSTISPWLSILPPNNDEQLDPIPRVRFQSIEDLPSIKSPRNIFSIYLIF